MLFTILLLFAQAYGCGGYSAASYNQCPASSVQQSVSTPGTVGQSSDNGLPSTSSTPSAMQSSSSQATPTSHTAPANARNTPSLIANVAHMDYGTLLAISLGVALCLAIILLGIRWLVRRRRERTKS